MLRDRPALVFIALSYALAWAGAFVAKAFPGLRDASAWSWALGAISSPALAALICTLFQRGAARLSALGFKPMAPAWWLYAWAIGLVLAPLSVLATMLLTGSPLSTFEGFASNFGGVTEYGPGAFAHAALGVATINVVLRSVDALTEEVGWRGYLYARWRAAGFWRCSLATGLIWGVWHAPFILLLGDLFGARHSLQGVALLTLVCMLLSPLMTIVRDRGGVIAAGLLHGTLNALSPLTVFALVRAWFPWSGFFGLGGCAVLATICLVMARRELGQLWRRVRTA